VLTGMLERALVAASMAIELNCRGIRSARAGKWHRSSVANLLRRTNLAARTFPFNRREFGHFLQARSPYVGC
jgi:hypothetical protein